MNVPLEDIESHIHGGEYTRSCLYDELVQHAYWGRGNIVIEKCAGIVREDGESNVGPDI